MTRAQANILADLKRGPLRAAYYDFRSMNGLLQRGLVEWIDLNELTGRVRLTAAGREALAAKGEKR